MKINPITIRQYSLTILMILFVLYSEHVWSDEAMLTDITLANTRDDLLIYMGIEGCFSHEITRAIMSGVPATFKTFIGLYKVRRGWMDRQIAVKKILHTIKYDPMKKEFTVTRSWDKNSPYVTTSFPEAQHFMSRIDNLTITSLNELTRGTQYQIRAKAELDEVRLPLYLHHVLFFVSMWNVETDWHTVDFIY